MNKIEKKYLIIMGIAFVGCIITTTLVLTSVLNQKFIALSFGFVAFLQATLGIYQKKYNNKAYKTSFICAAILMVAAICFIFV